MTRLRRHLFLLALLPAAMAVGPRRPTQLVLATYGDALDSEVPIAVLTEAYRRLGVTLEIKRFAGDVALDRSQSGALDGDVQRVDGLGEQFPTLIQVPIPIAWSDVAVYSHDSTLHVRDWRDLSRLNVATVRGVKALERSTGGLKVRYVDTYAELYPLLLTGQVDAIIASTLQSTVALHGTSGIYENDLLGSFLLYHYLHRRHAALEPEVARVLKEMLVDGTVARLRIARLAELVR